MGNSSAFLLVVGISTLCTHHRFYWQTKGKKMEEKLDAQENVVVTVLSSMGREAIVSYLVK